MDLDRIRTVVEEAVSASVHGIKIPGIWGAEVKKVTVSSKQLRLAGVQLEQHGSGEIGLSAEVELHIRISNNDLLTSIECAEFRVTVNADGNDIRAVASSETNWGMAWERGIEPIKQAALQSMKSDIQKMDETLAEDSYSFQVAMVLFASEFVGPYVDHIATLLQYPRSLVQVMAARFQEAKIWEGDEVRSEHWFEPQRGWAAFMLDLLVGNGKAIRTWSDEKNDYVYDVQEISANSPVAV